MFIIVTINIVVLMVTNSFFSALSPYLWLGDVYEKSVVLAKFYAISTSLFYLANTFFAILLLYLNHRFAIDATSEDASASRNLSKTIETSQDESFFPKRKSPYLDGTQNIFRS